MQEILVEAVRKARGRKMHRRLAAVVREVNARFQVSSRREVAAPAGADDYREREARRWKHIREDFLRTNRSVTAPELAELTGSKSRNPSSRAHEWLRAGKVFSVNDGNATRYPLFQIDITEGKPRPEVREIVTHLREQLADWQMAVWFTTPNAWTGDWRRPVDLLGAEPDLVVEAARHEVAEKVL